MGYQHILFEKRDRIATITLNRPEKLNAISGIMFRELKLALADVEEDDNVRVLVLTGAGRAFCSSLDLKEDRQQRMGLDHPPTQEDLRRFLRKYPQFITRKLRSLDKPTIAMVNGLAVGDGMDWALVCDIRIGSENTRFRNGFVNMGLVPNTGATWLYPRVMGLGNALEFMYTGDWMGAEEAHRVGVLNHLVPAAALEKETMALARRIADGPTTAQRLVKTLTYAGLNMDLDEALELAATGEAMTISTADHKEAVAAFKEKRKPVYTGG